jgi:hypothetical protein
LGAGRLFRKLCFLLDKILAAIASIALFSTASAQAATFTSVRTQAVAAAYTETAAPADSFADSVGFDANYEDHTYPPLVTTELEWSGVRHLRDGGATSPLLIGIFGALGAHGIGHSIGMTSGFAASTLQAQLAAFRPYVDFVEPANEADNVAHPNYAQMRSDQVRLYATVRADSANKRVAVLGPSFANPAAHAALVGPLDSYEDYGQLHNATCDWEPSTTLFGSWIFENIAKIRATTVYKPIVTTETGYTDDFTRGCSLPDDNIARYVPRESALRFMAGMPRTYFLWLVVRPADVVFGALGMLRVDGTPKPQFLTLANMVHLTADPGPAIASRKVSYAISGATADVDHLMLARRDGSYDLLLWRELPSWSHQYRTQMPVAPENVRVALPAGLSLATMSKNNAAYGVSTTQLGVTSGATAAFPIDDKITTLHLYRSATAAAIRRF